MQMLPSPSRFLPRRGQAPDPPPARGNGAALAAGRQGQAIPPANAGRADRYQPMPVRHGIQPPPHMPRRGLGGGGVGGQARDKRARDPIVIDDDDDEVIVIGDDNPRRQAARQAPFLGPAAADIATLRAEAIRRLALKPNLKTAKARRQAVDEGRTQDSASELTRDAERAALELIAIYPAYALRSLLGERLEDISVDYAIQGVVNLVTPKGGGKWLHECCNMWRDLTQSMEARGVRHDERARQVDVQTFLNERAARAKGGAQPLPAAARARPDPDEPIPRTRDGSSAAPGALAKLKTLRWPYGFDICTDSGRVSMPSVNRLPKQQETAPSPSLFLMKVLQQTAANRRLPRAVRNIAWASCLCAYAVIREAQASHFTITAEWQHMGTTILFGKTKRKVKKDGRTIAEPFILPLCGILDNEDWWYAGSETIDHLPEPGAFAACDFTSPRGFANDPYAATAQGNSPLAQGKFDKALRSILQREAGLSAGQAALYSRHCLKHFLGDITVHADDRNTASMTQTELGRWASSTLGRSPGLAPDAHHAAAFVLDFSRTARIYSANADLRRITTLSIQQMRRAQRAIESAGAHLPVFGGWDLIQP